MKKSALLLIVAPLALAACGGGSAQVKVDPVAYVRHSAQKTAAVPSEHMVLTGSVSAADINISASGDFANTPARGSLVASFSAPGLSANLHEVVDGRWFYASSPYLYSRLPAGKTWVKIDLAKPGRVKGMNYLGLTSQTPEQALGTLEAAGTVTKVGAERIHGAPTTHFRVDHLDISKLPDGGKLGALGSATYGPIDVWIGNADGYVYRETVSFSILVSGVKVSMTMTTDFSKFGEVVHLTVPPASETVELTSRELQGVER